jgi:histidine kinase
MLSTLAVILLLAIGVFILSRWMLVPSLTTELKGRGLGIAQAVADSSRGFILTENIPELVSLIFDAAQLPERRPLISYIFILDAHHNVLSHTYISPFPEKLRQANRIDEAQLHSIKLIEIRGDSAYDVAVPVIAGINRIGTVHVGLSKAHIDRLDRKLSATFVGIIVAISIVGFLISQILSKYITRPIAELIRVSDEVSRGNLDIKPSIGSNIRCWEIEHCTETNCPAYHNTELPCWYIDGTLCAVHPEGKFPDKLESCKGCIVYKKRVGDEIVRLADSFANMTLRLKTSEAELKASEEKYLILFYYHPNSIFVLDAETFQISDANAQAMNVYGYKQDELIGKSFMDLGTVEFDEGILSPHGRGTVAPFSVYSKVQHFRKDGKPFYVDIYACRTGHNLKYGLIVSTIDITESLAKESQLIQAGKMTTLGEMAAGIGHELNQPLSAIQIGADFLHNMVIQGQVIEPDELVTVSEHMSEQVARAVRIINHLREFGRKAEIKTERVDINTPIEGALTLLGQQLKVRGIRVVLDLKSDLPPIMGDANRLEQVFIDLVVNARDSIEEKREHLMEKEVEDILTVKSFEENGRVVVTISDTGTGMSEDIKEKIFEPFFTTKEVGIGTGLGLSISYGIIKDYNGSIEVQSEVTQGTRFKISFPAHAMEDYEGNRKRKNFDHR